jgi:phosphoglycerate dehydrogenase-like enzyme
VLLVVTYVPAISLAAAYVSEPSHAFAQVRAVTHPAPRLPTRASAGFMASVSEWIVGVMIDLSRGISASAAQYHAGGDVPVRMGRELRGATLGVIGYGQISRYLCPVAQALGMRVVVADPFATVDQPGVAQAGLTELLAAADYVVCLAPANAETENMMNAQAFAAMKRGAFFINASRGNLVDDAALAGRAEQRSPGRRCRGRGPRARPDAVGGRGAPPAGDCHAAHRRADAAGH